MCVYQSKITLISTYISQYNRIASSHPCVIKSYICSLIKGSSSDSEMEIERIDIGWYLKYLGMITGDNP